MGWGRNAHAACLRIWWAGVWLAAAAVVAATIVVSIEAEPTAATAAAQKDEDDDEPSAVTVTHGRLPPFELHSILWWAAESVTAAAFDFPPFLKKLIS